MTYMNFDEVRQWEHTFNTITEESNRGLAYQKFKEKKIIVLDKLAFKKPKTKKAYEILEKFKLIDKKVLVILENTRGDEARSFRNIENVLVTSAKSLNTYNILISDYLVFTKNSLTELVGGLANEGS